MIALLIQKMARKAGNKILTSPCFSKMFLIYISLFLSIPCLSFIYSLWFLLITIPLLLLSTLLHISLFNKKNANPGSLQISSQEGTPKFHRQVREQENETKPETNRAAKIGLETADPKDNKEEEKEEEEEGLIEIALAGEAKEETMDTVMKCLSDSGLIGQEEEEMMMEIWAEYEEDNFIEIDLSMGSNSSLKVRDHCSSVI